MSDWLRTWLLLLAAFLLGVAVYAGVLRAVDGWRAHRDAEARGEYGPRRRWNRS